MPGSIISPLIHYRREKLQKMLWKKYTSLGKRENEYTYWIFRENVNHCSMLVSSSKFHRIREVSISLIAYQVKKAYRKYILNKGHPNNEYLRLLWFTKIILLTGLERKRFSIPWLRNMLFYGCQGQASSPWVKPWKHLIETINW